MEGGAALGYMVAICHGYSHQTDQPCPALNIQYFHFLCHLFRRILSHSNWRIHTHWGLWFDLIHLSIEGMSELRVFNQLGPWYSTLDWIFKNKINLPSLPRQEPTRMWTPLDYPLPWINITVNFGFEEKNRVRWYSFWNRRRWWHLPHKPKLPLLLPSPGKERLRTIAVVQVEKTGC